MGLTRVDGGRSWWSNRSGTPLPRGQEVAVVLRALSLSLPVSRRESDPRFSRRGPTAPRLRTYTTPPVLRGTPSLRPSVSP